jgi:hypothetical protein
LANTLSIAPIVGALVEVSNSMDYTGAYEKSTVGGSLFVAPSQTRNVTGAFVPTTRPLDILVTLPFQERTAAETLDLILSQVSQGGKVQVAQGTVPFMMMATSKVLMVADKEPARSVLGRMFYLLASGPMADGSTVPRIGYQLLCDHIFHNCALNIHIVGSTDARTAVPLSGSILAGWSPRKTN